MQQRFAASQSALHQLSQLDVALNRLAAMRGQLGALRAAVKGAPSETSAGTAIDTLEKQMKEIEAVITSNPGSAESTLRAPDQIREHLLALAGGLEGEDDAPTPALLDQAASLTTQYSAALAKFNDWLDKDVAAFNRTMADGHLTGVVAGDPLAP
jgi:hypothetical protein